MVYEHPFLLATFEKQAISVNGHAFLKAWPYLAVWATTFRRAYWYDSLDTQQKQTTPSFSLSKPSLFSLSDSRTLTSQNPNSPALHRLSSTALTQSLSLSLSHRSHALYPTDLTPMALEWLVLGYAAAAEAIMVLLLIIPGLDGLRRGLIAVTCNLLKPFLSMVPFCLFLLMDIYWKYETRPSCEGDSCTPTEHLRHQKSIMKSQRNALLIASALLFYSVTNLVVKNDHLNQRVERLKNRY
ncbi:hypothetical protein PIB30_039359 [Stylosanthes scabra]|uniref:Endoplasmic reticulum transmembrane protein n=1 Tax=Stylosanthes scabra TaxID=79078 RepID=A0ABU6VD16_9FABA|nr:hypothetical protein [Stylosanthes scabra]